MTIITKEMVVKALAVLYVNRSKRDGFHYVRSILQRWGNGASNINELDPALYERVCAAVTIPSAQDFYGTVTDVCTAPFTPPASHEAGGSAPPAPSRIRSALAAELEARLKERAGKPRSKPNYVVNVGSPEHFGDQADDVVRDFPAGERVR